MVGEEKGRRRRGRNEASNGCLRVWSGKGLFTPSPSLRPFHPAAWWSEEFESECSVNISISSDLKSVKTRRPPGTSRPEESCHGKTVKTSLKLLGCHKKAMKSCHTVGEQVELSFSAPRIYGRRSRYRGDTILSPHICYTARVEM